MSVNQSKAFEMPYGLVAGESGAYISGGAASPVGQSASVGVMYFRSNGEVWRKYDAGVNDWEKLFLITDPNAINEGDFLRFLGGQWASSGGITGIGTIQSIGFSGASVIVVNHGLNSSKLIWQIRKDTTAGDTTVRLANTALANTFRPGVGFQVTASEWLDYADVVSVVYNTENQFTVTLSAPATGEVIVMGA